MIQTMKVRARVWQDCVMGLKELRDVNNRGLVVEAVPMRCRGYRFTIVPHKIREP